MFLKVLKRVSVIIIASLFVVLYTYAPFQNKQQMVSSDLQELPSYTEKEIQSTGTTENTSKTLPETDAEAPTAPLGLCVLKENGNSIELKWNASSDNIGVMSYSIYKSEARPQGINLIRNGGFEAGLAGWKIEISKDKLNPVKLSIDNSEMYSGAKSARIKTANDNEDITGEGSIIKLKQSGTVIKAGKNYIVSFKAKSNKMKSATVQIDLNIKPYTALGTWDWNKVDLTDNWQYFKRVFTATESSSENTRLSICFDGAAGTIWIDDIEMYEASVTPYVLADTSEKTSLSLDRPTSGSLLSFFVKARDAAGNVSTESNVYKPDINAKGVSNPIHSRITIDGEIADWKDLKPVSTGSGMLESLSAVQDQNMLYILVEGSKIGEKNSIFINSDNNDATGYSDSEMRGADYYLDESDNLFVYSDNNGKKHWEFVAKGRSHRNRTTLELVIDLMDMEIAEPADIRILFRDWVTHENIPLLEKGMALADTIITGVEDDTPPTVPIKLKSPARTMKTATLVWSYSTDNIGVKGYAIYRDGKKVGSSPYGEFSDSGLSEGTEYQYCIRAYDSSGNMSGESNKIMVTTNTAISGAGAITREYWRDIWGSWDSLKSNSHFPNNPDGTDQSTSFASPIKLADDYATRMSGYICPLKSGNYIFYISSDDSSELWLSTDQSPENKKLIANVNGYSELCEWSKYKSQKSASINLAAGKKYYVEAIQIEGCLGDHMEVGWQLPGSNTIVVVPGANLSPAK